MMLLKPLEKQGFKNRVVLAPMTRARADEGGVPNDMMLEYYIQRSDAGLMISEGVHISPQGAGWDGASGIWRQDQIDGWKKITDGVHQHNPDAKFAMQLWHLGRQMHSDVSGMPIVSASEIPLKGQVSAKNGEKKDPEVPHMLTEDEIADTVRDYAVAAKNAMEAGFDMVEIHAANGYLIDAFLQSATNKRTDKYGQDRLLFMKQVVDAILEDVPASKVGIRFSPNGVFGEMGSADNTETFTKALEFVGSKELAFVHLLDGLGFGFHELCEPFTLKYARSIVKGMCIIGNCGYTKETAEEQIKAGNADMVSFGRPFISTPDLVYRFANNIELNPPAEYGIWYSRGAEGYTTFEKAK